MLDHRQQEYFRDAGSFRRGMQLLQRYLEHDVGNKPFKEAEELLLGIIDDDASNFDAVVLSQALDYHNRLQIEQGLNPYVKEISALATLLKKQVIVDSELIVNPITSITLDQAFKDFVLNKRESWGTTGGMVDAFKNTYFPIIKESLDENIKTDKITRQDTIRLVKIIQNLPSNRKKHARYKNIKIIDFLNAEVPKSDRLSSITLTRYLGQIGTFFRWLKSNDYTATNLDEPLKSIKVKKVRSVDQQPCYTKDDLRKLFNSDKYIHGLHTKASHFWVPLIALYTGARLNEICQLSITDLVFDDSLKIWAFDINENHDEDEKKSIKKSYHARFVPVHKKLIELGFLEFHKSQKDKKFNRLFPDLPYVGIANKYGDKITRWFNRTYQKNCHISTVGASFHSFRHTVISHLVIDKNVNPNEIAVGLGQTPTGGVTQTTYTKPMQLKAYAPLFDRINFDDCYDSKLIRNWKHHLFNK